MDTNCAIADVRAYSAEIWAGLKSPIIGQLAIARELGLDEDQVTVPVVDGGGSFGRRLFFDGALEAAGASQAMGAPVKLMWHRADDARMGRAHLMALSRVRATYGTDEVSAFQQQHVSVETDFRHGLGEVMTAVGADLPEGIGSPTSVAAACGPPLQTPPRRTVTGAVPPCSFPFWPVLTGRPYERTFVAMALAERR
jgi:isoquinoline 1-oxidoreductase beta subunit